MPPNAIHDAANSFSFHPIRSSIFYHSIAIRFYFNAWIYVCSSCVFYMCSCTCIATVARHGDGNCCGSNVACNVLNFQRTAKQLNFQRKMISMPWKWVETKHLILHSIRVMGCFDVCVRWRKKNLDMNVVSVCVQADRIEKTRQIQSVGPCSWHQQIATRKTTTSSIANGFSFWIPATIALHAAHTHTHTAVLANETFYLNFVLLISPEIPWIHICRAPL